MREQQQLLLLPVMGNAGTSLSYHLHAPELPWDKNKHVSQRLPSNFVQTVRGKSFSPRVYYYP